MVELGKLATLASFVGSYDSIIFKFLFSFWVEEMWLLLSWCDLPLLSSFFFFYMYGSLCFFFVFVLFYFLQVFVVAVLAIFPLVPKNLSIRAYRLSLIGTACSSLYSLYSTYGVTLLFIVF